MTTSYYGVGPRQVVQEIVVTELQYRTITAGEPVNQWEIVYQDGTFIRQSQANDPNRMDGVGLTRQQMGSGVPVDVVIRGRITNTAWTWTSGDYLYASDVTSGALTHTLPTASGRVVQRIALALTATQIELNPQRGYQIGE